MAAVRCCRLLCCLSVLVVTVNAACTFTDTPGVSVSPSGTPVFQSLSAEQCKAECGDGCGAVSYDSDATYGCFTFTESQAAAATLTPDAAYTTQTFYRKSCADASPCTMEQQDKTPDGGNSLKVEVEASVDSCTYLCRIVDPCHSASFDSNNNECTLHTSTPQAGSGSVQFTKEACGDGVATCCFTSGGASTSSIVLPGSDVAASCKTLCEKVNDCTVVFVSDSTCQFFTTAPTTQTAQGSTYYAKICTGNDPSTGSFEAECGAAATQLPYLLVLFVAVVFTALL